MFLVGALFSLISVGFLLRRNPQKYAEIHRNTQKYPSKNTPSNTQKYPSKNGVSSRFETAPDIIRKLLNLHESVPTSKRLQPFCNKIANFLSGVAHSSGTQIFDFSACEQVADRFLYLCC